MTMSDQPSSPLVVESEPLGEPRLLIGGELRFATDDARYLDINPATEEPVGEVADASVADVDCAISAARRAFDETTWSTDSAFRQRCLLQLQEALERDRELLRQELIAEVGAPLLTTFGPQLDMPLAEAVSYPARAIDEFEWERELPLANGKNGPSRRTVVKEPVGVVGAIIPWNFPLEITLHKLAPALATG